MDLPLIHFIAHDGSPQVVEIANGLSLMEGALNAGVAGIDADCRGACACATCRVGLDNSWFERLRPPSALEIEMLEMAEDRDPHARLSCQIVVSADLDGLVVRLPATQA